MSQAKAIGNGNVSANKAVGSQHTGHVCRRCLRGGPEKPWFDVAHERFNNAVDIQSAISTSSSQNITCGTFCFFSFWGERREEFQSFCSHPPEVVGQFH